MFAGSFCYVEVTKTNGGRMVLAVAGLSEDTEPERRKHVLSLSESILRSKSTALANRVERCGNRPCQVEIWNTYA